MTKSNTTTTTTTTTTTKNKDTARDECPACGKYLMYPWDAWANARRCQDANCGYIERRLERNAPMPTHEKI